MENVMQLLKLYSTFLEVAQLLFWQISINTFTFNVNNASTIN